MFKWDVYEHESAGTPFEFEAEGREWRVPHVGDLLVGQKLSVDAGHLAAVLRDVAEVKNKDGEWEKAGLAAQKLVLGKHEDQVAPFLVSWLAHAGLQPGESLASSR